MRLFLAVGAVAAAVLASPSVRAHTTLITPAARYEQSDIGDPQKSRPCGVGGASDVRGKNVTVYEPGQEITVEWKETVRHPGHFRILFDPNGQSFPDPTSYTDFDAGGDKTLADNIPHLATGSLYRQTVKLPDVECDRCTLQLLQVMTDKPPFGPGGGDDFYAHCADITLVRKTSTDGGVVDPSSDAAPAVDSPSTSAACGCRTTGRCVSGAPFGLLMLLAARATRRRSAGGSDRRDRGESITVDHRTSALFRGTRRSNRLASR